MSSEDQQHANLHIVKQYFGSVVEKGNVDKLCDYFSEYVQSPIKMTHLILSLSIRNYVGHFPNKEVNFECLKDIITQMHQNLVGINVEIGEYIYF